MNVVGKKTILIALISIFSINVFAVTKSRFEQLELFNKVLYLVESQYYREVDTEKLIEGAINGMMGTLDPHSSFLNKKYFKKMQNETDGEFGGLGIEVTLKDGVLYIVRTMIDTPAFRKGLQPKDKIVEINGESTLGWTLDQAVEKMRGKNGSNIDLGISRTGKRGVKNYILKRETIQVKPVKYELIAKNIAWVRLTQFQKRSASSIVNALKKMNKKKQVKGIILDLRSNPGGLLDQAVDVSSIFLKNGVVVSTEARDPSNKNIMYVKKTGYKDTETPLIVLINGSSASASEIVAGALKDHRRGIIMGSTSFGKGSVQTVAQIDKENGVKLTIAQYMTPSGKKIQAIGIEPDVILDDLDKSWVDENKKDDLYLRERDLKNHLNATIETPEEKATRLKEEEVERKKRIAKIKKKKSKKKKTENNIFTKYDPKNDYQVMQAVNYLKSFKVFKEFQSVKN